MRRYFVRVAAENAAKGSGHFVSTEPAGAEPRGIPFAPTSVAADVVDKNSVRVSWHPASARGGSILGYRVESMTKSFVPTSLGSYFGMAEVQQISTYWDWNGIKPESTRKNNATSGSFTLSFGPHDVALPGTVAMMNGKSYMVTTHDLTPFVSRGDAIVVNGKTLTVAARRTFNSTHVYVEERYTGDTVLAETVYASHTTTAIPHNATAAELEAYLENLPSLGAIHVSRSYDEDYEGYVWTITFDSDVGDQPGLFANPTGLRCSLPDCGYPNIRIGTIFNGLKPDNYTSTIVDASTSNYVVRKLETGVTYSFRVTAISDRGLGDMSPIAISIPAGAPGMLPDLARLTRYSTDLLKLTFQMNAPDNGDAVTGYVVETSPSSAFSLIATTRYEFGVDYTVQKISTDAHTRPFAPTAAFSLSVGDFEGSWIDFDVAAANQTLVDVAHGGSLVTLSTAVPGASERKRLNAAYARGDFLRVGGQVFTVCLQSDDLAHNVTSYDFDFFRARFDAVTLPLCDATDPWTAAYYDGGPRSDDLLQAPLYKLDTALGAAFSPALGDTSLSPRASDELLSDRDWRHLGIRRGDFIRVGHPVTGETFRVSTDMSKIFSATNVPLASVDDANVDASLTAIGLTGATFEIQEIRVFCAPSGCNLTGSEVSASGYRLAFGDVVTGKMAAGGDGCLLWDGSAEAVKAELESLPDIDLVAVTRHVMSIATGDMYNGVRYLVTFTGSLVRGNVPTLEVTDLGVDGCIDAEDSSPTYVFRNNVSSSVRTVQRAYVPVWRAQTTEMLAWDASAADVKYALEALGQICTVDVRRVIETGSNGFAWYVTFTAAHQERNDNSFAYTPMFGLGANDAILDAAELPTVEVLAVREAILNASTTDGRLFVRLAAFNSYGAGPFRASSPPALTASPQKPEPPSIVRAEIVSPNEILVEWTAPHNNGGQAITSYEIEWDRSENFNSRDEGYPIGELALSASSFGAIADVQSFTIAETTGERFLGGFFQLAFDGQITRVLPFDASASDVENALEALCTIEDVTVERELRCSAAPDVSTDCVDPQGYTWLVTFSSIQYGGDQHTRFLSTYQSVSAHKLSVDGTHLLSCENSEGASPDCWRYSVNTSAVLAVTGSRQEVQSLYCDEGNTFYLSIAGVPSALLKRRTVSASFRSVQGALVSSEGLPLTRGGVGADAQISLEEALESIIGSVALSCPMCVETVQYNGVNVTWLPCNGQNVTIEYLSARGDIPPLQLVSASRTHIRYAREVVKGRSQEIVGRLAYSALVSESITHMHKYYFRVSAYSSVGSGEAAVVTLLSPLQPAVVAPREPLNISATRLGSHEVLVSWNPPSSNGGSEIVTYVVEWDTAPSFKSQCVKARGFDCADVGPLGTAAVSETLADNTLSIVAYAVPDHQDASIRRQIALPISALGYVSVGDAINAGGAAYTVKSINKPISFAFVDFGGSLKCGSDVLCIELDSEYIGPHVNGSSPTVHVFFGPSVGSVYSYAVTDLKSGIDYFFRVAARTDPVGMPGGDVENDYLQGSWTAGRATARPGDGPEVVEVSHLTPGDLKSTLHLDWLPPRLSAYPEGDNGSPVTGYQFEFSTRAYARQRIRITLSSDADFNGVGSSEYQLQYKDAITSCLTLDATPEVLELRLEELVGIDGASVTLDTSTSTLREYTVLFDGDYELNGAADALVVVPNAQSAGLFTCNNYPPSVVSVSTEFVSYNDPSTMVNAAHIPEVVVIRTGAADGGLLEGVLELEWDFTGAMELGLYVPEIDAIATVSVEAGSALVYSLGTNLTALLNRGDAIRIGHELHHVDVDEDTLFTANTFPIVDYHLAGCDNCILFVENTRLGRADQPKIQRSARLRNEERILSYKNGNVEFASNAHADSGSATLFRRASTQVRFDATAEELRTALESLPGLGAVEVSRFGPNTELGYVWSITLVGLDGATECPDSPCLEARATTSRFVLLRDCVDVDLNGAYIDDTTVTNGRVRYARIDAPFALEYNRTGWQLVGDGNWVIGKLSSPSASYSPPAGTTFVGTETFGCTVQSPEYATEAQLLYSSLTGPNVVSENTTNSTCFAVSHVVRSGQAASFSALAVKGSASGGMVEVQKVEMRATADDIEGTFRVSFADAVATTGTFFRSAAPVVIEYDATAHDFKTQLEGLSSIGTVEVAKKIVSDGHVYGADWIITFTSQPGRLPLLTVDSDGLSGSNLALNHVRVSSGADATLSATANHLTPGKRYSARLRAVSAIGVAPFTNEAAGIRGVKSTSPLAQGQGAGVLPFSLFAGSVPGAPPDIKVRGISASQLAFEFAQPESPGSAIDAYLLEWTTESSFDSTAGEWIVEVSNSAGLDDLQGRWRIWVGSHSTRPLAPNASIDEVEIAMNLLPNLGQVKVIQGATSTKNIASFRVKLTQDIGERHGLFVDTTELQSVSLNGSIAANTHSPTSVYQREPDNYGSLVIYTGYDAVEAYDATWRADGKMDAPRGRCGATYLGTLDKVNSVQYLKLDTTGGIGVGPIIVAGGSYRLELGGFSTDCIPHDANATYLKAALEALPYVNSVDVTAYDSLNRTGFPFEYRILFRGTYVDGIWPALHVESTSFGKSWVSQGLSSGCEEWQPSRTGLQNQTGMKNVTAFTFPMAEHPACDEGYPEVQAIVIEGNSELGGTFDVHLYGSRTNGISVSASAQEVETMLESLDGVGSIQVTKHNHEDQPYGTAWVVTFDNNLGQPDVLTVTSRHLTGNDATANVYPLVNVTTTAILNDLDGDVELLVGDEITVPISWAATRRKVLKALHDLDAVGRVSMLGASDGSLVKQIYLPNGTAFAAVVLGDLTSAVAEGDLLRLGNESLQSSPPTRLITHIEYFAHLSHLNQTLRQDLEHALALVQDMSLGVTVLRLSSPFRSSDMYAASTLGDYGLYAGNVAGSYTAYIGETTRSRVALPGKVSWKAPARVIAATSQPTLLDGLDYSRIVYLRKGDSATLNRTSGGILNGSVVYVDSFRYRVEGISPHACGQDCLLLNKPFHVDVSDGLPDTPLYLSVVVAACTADLRSALTIGDPIWVRDMEFAVLSLTKGTVSMAGPFPFEVEGATAFAWGYGYEWALVFKDFSSPIRADPGGANRLNALRSFRARPRLNWRGTGAALRYSLPFGVPPHGDIIGAPAEVQTISLRAANEMAAASALVAQTNLTLQFDHLATDPLPWGATSSEIQAALEALPNIDHVKVSRTGDGSSPASWFGFSYTVTFWVSSWHRETTSCRV